MRPEDLEGVRRHNVIVYERAVFRDDSIKLDSRIDFRAGWLVGFRHI